MRWILKRPSESKIVFSSSLEAVEGNARLVRGDVGDVLREVRDEFAGDLGVGGPTLAAQFIERGLVDEYGLVIHPVVLGAGKMLSDFNLLRKISID